MRISGLLIFLLALGLAGGVAFLVNEWMNAQQDQVAAREAALEAERRRLAAEQERLAAQQSDSDKLLVAARELAIGTKIDEEGVAQREIAPEERPTGAYSWPDQVLGKVVLRKIAEGEPIRSADLDREKRLEKVMLIRGTESCETEVGTDCR
jgi:Flp pilus assembly protein CpaB